jgi:hypothetical protein
LFCFLSRRGSPRVKAGQWGAYDSTTSKYLANTWAASAHPSTVSSRGRPQSVISPRLNRTFANDLHVFSLPTRLPCLPVVDSMIVPLLSHRIAAHTVLRSTGITVSRHDHIPRQSITYYHTTLHEPVRHLNHSIRETSAKFVHSDRPVFFRNKQQDHFRD